MRTRLRHPRQFLRRLGRDAHGNTAIEFAFLAPFLIAIFFGIFEFGRAIWVQGILDYAVEQAARCYSINTSTCGSASATQTYAAQQAAPLPAASPACPSGATCPVFTASQPASGTCAGENEVTGSYDFSFLSIGALPILGQAPFPTSITLSSQSCYPI